MSIIQGQFTTGMGIYHNMKDWKMSDPSSWLKQNQQFADIMDTGRGEIVTELKELVETGFLGSDKNPTTNTTYQNILKKMEGMKPGSIPTWAQFVYYANFILNYHTPSNTAEIKRVEDDSSGILQTVDGQNAQTKSTMQTLIGNHNEVGGSANKMIQQLGKLEENANSKTGQR